MYISNFLEDPLYQQLLMCKKQRFMTKKRHFVAKNYQNMQISAFLFMV